jgi:hypothetical protein
MAEGDLLKAMDLEDRVTAEWWGRYGVWVDERAAYKKRKQATSGGTS